jgi:hypothetical protein
MNAAGDERMSDAQRPAPRRTDQGGEADEGRDPGREDRGGRAPAQDDERGIAPERSAGTDGDEARDHPDGIQIQTE